MRLLTAAEARDLGVVLELNRQLLHPRGLALQVCVDEPGDKSVLLDLNAATISSLRELVEWARTQLPDWNEALDALTHRLDAALEAPDVAQLQVQDHRDDPEGVYFGDIDDIDDADWRKARLFDELRRGDSRVRALGFDVQPLPEDLA